MKKTIYLLCSPSLAILDNWLPVVFFLKKLNKNIEFVLIIPKAEVVRQFTNENVLVNISRNIFDYVIYRRDSGLWVQSNSIQEAKDNVGELKGVISFLVKIKFKLQSHKIFNYLIIFLIKLFKIVDRYRNSLIFLNIKSLTNTDAILLYDIFEENKPYNIELMSILHKNKRFSIYHAIGINKFYGNKVYKDDENVSSKVRLDDNLKVYLFSKLQIDHYKRFYGVSEEHISIIGIPKHDQFWIDIIKGKPKHEDSIPKDDKYVLIVSRPLSEFISARRREEALMHIKKVVIENLGLKIVVKLHPKESKSCLYEKIFGISEYEKTWVYSDRHPLILGERSEFVITYFSSVCIDMLRLGVPCIEYLNLKGLENKYILMDGEYPVFGYRNFGLVYGASNYQQLELNVERIINNKDVVKNELFEKYSQYFTLSKQSASSVVAKDIINSF